MEDVARRAGVAVSTVSYALSGTRPISDATRRRIEAAMEELGYRPHAVARALASKRSRIIAVALPAIRGLGHTEFDFVEGAVEAAREHGYHVVVWPTEIEGRADLETLTGHGLVDGVLLMEVHMADARVEELRSTGRPMAMIGRTADPTGIAHVDIDFDQTATDAVGHLVELGHRAILFVNHSKAQFDAGYGPTVRMGRAYERAMRDAGLQPRAVFCDDRPEAGHAQALAMLTAEPDMTAVIAMNEPAIPGWLRALADLGMAVPRDFSVLSVVSSLAVAEMTVPNLTVFEAPARELGHRGVEALLTEVGERLESTEPVLLPCRFTVGSSTGPARSRPSRTRPEEQRAVGRSDPLRNEEDNE